MEKKKNALNGNESWLREHSVSINKLMLLYCPHKQQKNIKNFYSEDTYTKICLLYTYWWTDVINGLIYMKTCN